VAGRATVAGRAVAAAGRATVGRGGSDGAAAGWVWWEDRPFGPFSVGESVVIRHWLL